MKKPLFSTVLFSLSVSVISACGTNPIDLKMPDNSKTTQIQTQNNSDQTASSSSTNGGSLISDAKVNLVSEEEFNKLRKDPNFIVFNEEEAKKSAEEQRNMIVNAENTVREYAKSDTDFNNLLNNEPSSSDSRIRKLNDGNYLLKVRNSTGEEQEVVTLGRNAKLLSLASALKTFPAYENQVDIYKNMFDSLPEEEKEPASMSVKSEFSSVTSNQRSTSLVRQDGSFSSDNLFPRPERLARMQLPEIQRYNIKLTNRLYELIKIKIVDPAIPPGYVSTPASEVGAGTGNDRTNSSNPTCTTPRANGIYKNYNWKNKYFVTSVKNQGGRGTCVAFAITSAEEMSVAKKDFRWINLSEQDYYYKNKAVWWPSSYGDGLDTLLSWKKIKLSGYKMPYENDWNYNPSYSRTENNETLKYTHSCDGYGEECSDTNHQGKLSCIDTPSGKVCGTMGGGTTAASYTVPGTAQEIWNHSNKDLSIALTAVNLAIGNPVVVSLQVTPSFDGPDANGYAHYAGASETSRGGHALHVSGFITNETLAAKIPSAPAGAGGGYFIVKNSWGTCFGDTGYIYLPFEWIKKYTYSMTVRN